MALRVKKFAIAFSWVQQSTYMKILEIGSLKRWALCNRGRGAIVHLKRSRCALNFLPFLPAAPWRQTHPNDKDPQFIFPGMPACVSYRCCLMLLVLACSCDCCCCWLLLVVVDRCWLLLTLLLPLFALFFLVVFLLLLRSCPSKSLCSSPASHPPTPAGVNIFWCLLTFLQGFAMFVVCSTALTQRLSHRGHEGFYTKRLLHTEAFAQRLLQTEAFAHRSRAFCTGTNKARAPAIESADR